MNKKGMTLIELLAVVGILAMLFMLVAPNAINAFKNSKKSSFLTDVQTIYTTAIAQVQADHPRRVSDFYYCRNKGEECEHSINNVEGLELSGNTETNYIIQIDRQNNVVFFLAQNGEYQYSYSASGSSEELTDSSQITIDDIVRIDEPEANKIFNFDSTVQTKVDPDQ